MQSGFNTNIRHRGTLFHVQSEDSGRGRPHIITHVYHGGTILASEKSSYADRLEEKDLDGVVRALMEAQHKAVLRRLVGGDLDAVIRERLGPAALGEAPGEPGPEAAVTKPEVTDLLDDEPPAPVAAEPAPAPVAAKPASAPAPGHEQPLDEMILSYLVENARKRKPRPQ
jgi:hypothetical protein